MCVACGDKQCTTSFSLQSRCMDTAAALISGPADTTVQNVGGQSMPEDSANPPVDETAKFLRTNSFLQIGAAGNGAYERASNGFCKCAADYCKSPLTATTFTCKSTAKGWARKSL